MARVKLQSAARQQDRAASHQPAGRRIGKRIDRQQGARRSAGFRRTGGNHSRSRGKENDVKERYKKAKITYGRAKAGAVLLSILLRSLSNKFGVWHICHATRLFDSAEDTCANTSAFRSKQSNQCARHRGGGERRCKWITRCGRSGRSASRPSSTSVSPCWR